ncbi:MAG: ABC transporter ATP-binding protein [Bryobacteraceae bacterium]|nr:ABC transporter ATP-binding protein [Bryobacteraceae bacterium]
MSLICRDLRVEYEVRGKTVTALDGISFHLEAGEFISLIGPSGCGKTTMLRTIAGFLKPSRGSIEFTPNGGSGGGGRLIVYQEDSLFPWMTVLDNAAFGLEMKGVPRGARRQAAAEMLERHGLQGREDCYPYQLSAGMKQRVAVIRAFLSDPALLLMDEPFGSLDSPTRFALQEDLLDLWGRSLKPVVFVTHDVDEAIYLSDRVLVLSEGPGRVVDEAAVTLPREGRRDSILSEEFLRLKSRIMRVLAREGPHSKQKENHAA